MAEKMLILSPSGAGKTTSLRNMNPEETMVIQCVNKRLPFPHKDWHLWDKEAARGSIFKTRDFTVMKTVMERMAEVGKKYVVIDDFIYAISGRVMDDIAIKSYDKWSELAKEFYDLMEFIDTLPEDMYVIIMSHTDINEGSTKMKTAGKLIDNLITPEGMFNIVFGVTKNDSGSFFITNGTTLDPFKSPVGMFEEKLIPNDLQAALNRIDEFYNS